MGWSGLKAKTLTAVGDIISSSTFNPKTHLNYLTHVIRVNNIINNDHRFNNDSGNNYALRYRYNGTADGTVTSQAHLEMNVTTFDELQVVHGINISSQEKLIICHIVDGVTTGASTAPQRGEFVGKWANTVNQINNIDVIQTNTGDFDIGSNLSVLGTSQAVDQN